MCIRTSARKSGTESDEAVLLPHRCHCGGLPDEEPLGTEQGTVDLDPGLKEMSSQQSQRPEPTHTWFGPRLFLPDVRGRGVHDTPTCRELIAKNWTAGALVGVIARPTCIGRTSETSRISSAAQISRINCSKSLASLKSSSIR